jgi:hypothetical protein
MWQADIGYDGICYVQQIASHGFVMLPTIELGVRVAFIHLYMVCLGFLVYCPLAFECYSSASKTPCRFSGQVSPRLQFAYPTDN